MAHVVADGKARLLCAVTELSQAFALAVPHAEALRIRDDVGFFQAVRGVLAKSTSGEQKSDEELDLAIRQNVTVDWTIRDNVRAQLRVLVKRILRKHGYPLDKQEKATQTVLEQAEVLADAWAD